MSRHRDTGYQGRHRPETVRPLDPRHRTEPRPVGLLLRPAWADQPTTILSGLVLTHAQRLRLPDIGGRR
ncbi:hypothetical protein [Micromonospora sonneratiae]|uniref:Uncharacterized protein n=1 Tax=Micromonospora sonneratiae TaxID=1184706 RepID=A0ABW3YJ17_9ACTN